MPGGFLHGIRAARYGRLIVRFVGQNPHRLRGLNDVSQIGHEVCPPRAFFPIAGEFAAEIPGQILFREDAFVPGQFRTESLPAHCIPHDGAQAFSFFPRRVDRKAGEILRQGTGTSDGPGVARTGHGTDLQTWHE